MRRLSSTTCCRELKRFLYQGLCVLMLLQGPPLLALEGVAPPLEDRALTRLVDSVERWAAEPWLDAVAVLLTLGSPGEPRADAVPPLPPGFAPSRPLASDRTTTAYDAVDKDATAVALGPGWNLISLPAEPSAPDPAAVFAPIAASVERVYAYDACDPSDPWKLYDPASPATSDLVAIDHRMGLWVESRAHASLPIEGSPPASTDFSLCDGWNLVGYPSAVPRPVPSALAPLLGNLVRVFGYDAFDALVPWEIFDVAAPAWANDLVAMAPGRGYWVLVSAAADFELVNEGAPPEVSLDTPGDLSTVTSFADVVGTVRSPLLQGWTLTARQAGETGGTLVATGDFPVDSQTLGVLDPTLLQNGLFELELRAVDILGQTATITRQVVIDGGLKLGVFRLPFFDLELPLLGVPIGVIRTYDSRDKGQGDFGVGWRLSTSDVTVRDNGVQGKGWAGTKTNELIPLFCVVPTRAHLVILRFPDDEIYRFQGLIEPECQQVAPPQVVTIRYLPLPGTRGELEPLDQSADLFVAGSFPGEIDLLDFDTVAAYDPSRYRLTTEDGRQLVVDENHGLESITDIHGHRVTFSADGIEHSSGVGVDFQRDAAGRIAAIVDPAGHSIQYTYDGAGDLVSVTDQEGYVTQFTYLENHYLRTLIDPDGVEHLAAEYDGKGRWIGSCDNQGRCNGVEHDFDGQREIRTDASGRQTISTYDVRGNVISQTDGLGNTTHFRYDDRNNLVEIEDPLGHVTRQTFDSRGRRTSILEPHAPGDDPADFTSTLSYDARGNITRIRRPSGAELRLDYDARNRRTGLRDGHGTELFSRVYDDQGNLVSETTAAGTSTYDDFTVWGEPRQVTMANGLVLNATFDELGNITDLTDSEGNSTTYSYDRRSREIRRDLGGGVIQEFDYGFDDSWFRLRQSTGETAERLVDEQGRLVGWSSDQGELTFTRDAAGFVTHRSFPGGAFQGRVLDAAGQVVKTIAANGAETIHVYDAAGREIETRDSLGHATRFTYTPGGRVETLTNALGHTWEQTHSPTEQSLTDPLGRTTTTTFTPYGLVAGTIYPDGSSDETEYLLQSPWLDASSFPTRLRDRGGAERVLSYDVDQRLVRATDRAGALYDYVYALDSEQVESITGPTGLIAEFSYDATGRVSTVTRGDGGVTTFRYDASGLATTRTQPSGNSITKVENTSGEVVQETASDGTHVLYTYEPSGALSALEDSLGRHELEVDALGNLTEIRRASGAVLGYDSDRLGRLTAIRVEPNPGAALVTRYAHDAVGNVVTVEDPLGGETHLTYDAAGRRIRQQMPNGVVTTYGYDLLDQVAEVVHTAPDGSILTSVTYERLAMGEPSRITREDGSYRTLEYDGALRLIRESFFDAGDQLLDSIEYSYDNAGNRLSRTDSDGTATSAYLSGDRLAAVVDGDGNGDTFTWDADGRVSGRVRNGEEHQFAYDPWNRLRGVESPDGAPITRYAYDGFGQRVLVENAAGTQHRLVGPGHGELSVPHAVVAAGGELLGSYTYLDHRPLVRITDGEPTYYLTDAMGSVLALADSTGGAVARFAYDAFGNLRESSGQDAELPTALGGDYRFHGEWLERDTGLYHLRARDYDPESGRFLSPDPAEPDLGVPETFHPYTFAGGNPHLFADPTGLFTIYSVSLTLNIRAQGQIAQAAAINYVRDYLTDKVREVLFDGFVSLVTEFLDLDPNLFDLGDANSSIRFENLIFGALCSAEFLPGVHQRIWNEPRISNKGKRLFRGTNCEQREQILLESKGKRTQRDAGDKKSQPAPDLFVSAHTEQEDPKWKEKGLLIGDFKFSIDGAASKWLKPNGDPKNQLAAIANHARLHQHPPNVSILVTLFDGPEAVRKKLEKAASDNGSLLITVALLKKKK